MSNSDLLYTFARIVFFLMALVVIWNSLAPLDYRILTETSRKIWAMAGLSLYVVILIERRRRDQSQNRKS